MDITPQQRKQLESLGAKKLSDILLDLATNHDSVLNTLERLWSTPQESIARCKRNLASIKRRTRFINWRESYSFSEELEQLLHDIEETIPDPDIGLALIVDFYKADSTIFNLCDDSSGNIGDVFRVSARNLFNKFAAGFQNKGKIRALLLDLILKDDYGIRDSVLDGLSTYLGEPDIRKLIDQLWNCSEKENDDYQKHHIFSLIETMAKQIKDGPLFEKTGPLNWERLNDKAYFDIAEVYFLAGELQPALSWAERISDKSINVFNSDQLLTSIYKKLGNHEKVSEIAWRVFHRNRSKESLDSLIEVIGEDHRENVIKNEMATILQSPKLECFDADFLMKIGKIDEAEAYLQKHVDYLNGDWYTYLVPWAEVMEKCKKFLMASLLYRCLLDSILSRAISKYYHHGIRYLKKLEKLAPHVSDWSRFEPHQIYFDELKKNHGRKPSFWSKYADEK